ncbi:mechanosensitive ion channel family protein [Devosia sp. RR2S18]|uniref:mechanosensitive ion channel family protein n=1 Tax=Devosia rhizosphaerae TaxID=3049774 RepID=UPI0025426075|nr:mechanosensitive ion channel domain-containing protein [Devosia sp. RR2S18]WIJ26293.1 mechanosensitive ion channel [Devosia sp. RR2S18]
MVELQRGLAELERFLRWLPDWLIALIMLGIAILAALVAHDLLMRMLRRMVANRSMFWRSLVSRLSDPFRWASIIGFVAIASVIMPLGRTASDILRHILLLGGIALAVIAARTVLHIWMTLYLRRFKLDAEDNLLARKHATQSKILERVGVIIFVLVGLAAALMTFEGAAQYGASILASAGAAGLIVGLALQPLFKNLFAGVQLAITQPIRIDDAVLIEGEWGKIEEITATYVVVKIWDLRRLVVPLSYFLENPIQNWTREGATLIGSIIIYLDHSVPVEPLRRKAEEIVKGSPLWDGDVFALQVTDFKEFTMEVRVLMSARNSGDAFDLRCLVREQLVAYVQAEYPGGLPRYRADVVEQRTKGGGGELEDARAE